MLLGTTVHSLPLPHQTLRHQSQNAFRHTQKPSKAQHALSRHNHQVTVCRDLPIRIGDVAKFTRGFSEYAYQDSQSTLIVQKTAKYELREMLLASLHPTPLALEDTATPEAVRGVLSHVFDQPSEDARAREYGKILVDKALINVTALSLLDFQMLHAKSQWPNFP